MVGVPPTFATSLWLRPEAYVRKVVYQDAVNIRVGFSRPVSWSGGYATWFQTFDPISGWSTGSPGGPATPYSLAFYAGAGQLAWRIDPPVTGITTPDGTVPHGQSGLIPYP